MRNDSRAHSTPRENEGELLDVVDGHCSNGVVAWISWYFARGALSHCMEYEIFRIQYEASQNDSEPCCAALFRFFFVIVLGSVSL